jgi:DNA polymerase-3 subunit epsilon
MVITGGFLFFFFRALSEEQIDVLLSIGNTYPVFVVSIVLVWVVIGFTGLEIIYQAYIKPVKKISAEAAVIYSSNPSHRIGITGIRDIKNLSIVINDFADLFENLNKNITQQILAARKETEKERNLLAAIMAELPQGVIICNNNGRILLFNSLAKEIFTKDASLNRAEYFIGLGRSIFHLIDKDLVAHALEEIEESLNNDRESVASYFITPIHTGHLISIETVPMLDQERQMTGFIFMFQDVTEDINQYDNTHKHLLSLNKEFSDKKLLHKYEKVSDTILSSILTPLPLTKLFLTYFVQTVQQKVRFLHGVELAFKNQTSGARILVDTYSFTAAFVFLIQNLYALSQSKDISLSSFLDNKTVIFKIIWQGEPIAKKRVESIFSKRINALPSLFYVLKQNMAVFQIISDDKDRCSQINIIVRAELEIPTKQRTRAPVVAISRPEFYDFDLFLVEDDNIDLLDTRLDKITYTVFDTETTGLNPDGGDEIISIAAVRIVNSRIVYHDIFEELIDPKRNIPMDSYKIHGINYEMVTGKKDINDILPVFKSFVSETVLLGHNIAFDMKMLKVKEKSTGIKFLNPVMDTLLLSAVLHPIHEQHDMENIAKRLGVNIIGRHTALGDAIATAEIFLKLLPILKSNGILTLKDAIAASKKTYYARLKY